MPAFPLYIDLTDKKVLVFGGGEVALRKIRTLLAFQPLIEVYAENICIDLQKLIDEKKIFKAEAAMRFDEEKLPSVLDAFMVICATDNEQADAKAKEALVMTKIQEAYSAWIAENTAEFTDVWKKYAVVNPTVETETDAADDKTASDEKESQSETES